MGQVSTDIILYTMFEAALADLRKNPYLLADIFGVALEQDPLAGPEYGTIEYQNAYKWFGQNNISVIMHLRRDLPKFPCISIQALSSRELSDRATLSDTHTEYLTFTDPLAIQKAPTKIYSEFSPASYERETGIIELPAGYNTYQMAAKIHMVVEKNSRKGFVIQDVVDAKKFKILPNSSLDLKDIYIAPVTDNWNVHSGRARFQENFTIGCHGSSNPLEAIWLSQLVQYILLKYKFKYLEKRNIQLATMSAEGPYQNTQYTADNIYTKNFSLTFQTEYAWIDSVHPQLARSQGQILIDEAEETSEMIWESIKKQGWKPDSDGGRE